MRRQLTICLLLTALSLTGCGTARETEDIMYVMALGIDLAPEKKMEVTYQLAVPARLTGTAGTIKKEESALPTSFIATNLAEAQSLFNSTNSRTPNQSHVKVLVIGEKLARQGVGDLMASILRFRQFRGSVKMLIVKGSAKEFLTKNTPTLDIQPARYYESMFQTAKDSSYYVKTDAHEFYTRLKNTSGSPYTALGGVNPLSGHDQPDKKRSPPEQSDQYSAGSIPRSGSDNPVELAGTALFRGDKMVGTLTTEETRTLSMLLGEHPSAFAVFEDPLEPAKYVNIDLHLGRTPKIETKLDNGRPSITINLLLEGEITSIPSGINYEETAYRTLLEEQVNQVLRRRVENLIALTQELRCDPAGISMHFRPCFRTYQEMEEANVHDLYNRAQVEVTVITKIRRTGLMWRSSAIHQ